jgi:heme A synthase
MALSKWTRWFHRWVSVLFIATVLAASIAAATGQDTQNPIFYLPLAPLFVLMATGLYLFILPYVRGGKAGA